MSTIRIVPCEQYRGEGISEGLARGLLVFYGSENLTGEGMGIGCAAIKEDRCTYFSRSFEDSGDNPGLFTRTFFIDTKMSWSIRGTISPLLTRWIEAGIGLYMRLPPFQQVLMGPVMPIRKLLRIQPVFETVPLQAKVIFTYRVDNTGVGVTVCFNPVAPPHGTLCILNELSNRFFSASFEGGRIQSPPRGWERLPHYFPTSSLCDPGHGIRFWIDSLAVISGEPVNIFRGQESGEDVSWAGISFEAGLSGNQAPLEIRYHVGFAEDVLS